MLNKQEQAQLYLEAYRERMFKDDDLKPHAHRKAASEYAASVAPDVYSLLKEYASKVIAGKGKLTIEDAKIARTILNGTRTISFEYAKSQPVLEKPTRQPEKGASNGDHTLVDIYRSLADNFDFIPASALLSAVSGHTSSGWDYARRKIEGEGYKLGKYNEREYQVLDRPEVKEKGFSQSDFESAVQRGVAAALKQLGFSVEN